MGREVSFHGNDMSDDFGSDSRHGQHTVFDSFQSLISGHSSRNLPVLKLPEDPGLWG